MLPKIIRGFYKQHIHQQVGKPEELDTLLGTHSLPRLNHEEAENWNN